jgi:hypothetical protein
MSKVVGFILSKIKEILPAFIFFVIMFHILGVTRALALKQYGISTPASLAAVIGALIVAKVVLISDRLPFLNLYPKKPLIYNVVLKTIVFSFFTFLFLIVEELLHLSRREGSLAAAWSSLPGDVVWPAFWAREIWLFVLILFYCAATELARVVGRQKVREIFFG